MNQLQSALEGVKQSRCEEMLRLTTLAALNLLDTEPEADFDVLTELTKSMLGAKIALISLVDAERQWFKSACGLSIKQTPREVSFCSYAIAKNEPLVIPDTQLDCRFAENPFVKGTTSVRFYAGMPIYVAADATDGVPRAIGTLCVLDDAPRDISEIDLKTLRDLAQLAEALINARSSAWKANRLMKENQAYLLQLAREHGQFKQAERLANIGSWRMTIADSRTEWSDQVFVIHELECGEQPLLAEALTFYPAEDRHVVAASLARTVETGEPFEIEVDFITARGRKRRVKSKGELEIVGGEPIAVIGVFQDVTVQHDLETSLRRAATIDELTQLPNRAYFNQVLDEYIVAARARREALAVLLIDLDRFKLVNDKCGHLAGDDLLRRMSAKLRSPYLAKCFAARLGGDEFVIVVSDPEDCAELDQIIHQLLIDLHHSVRHDEGVVEVSGSIGISWLNASIVGRSDLLRCADKALYVAKRNRRGSAYIYSEASQAAE